MNTKLQGRWGEMRAADYLKQNGYTIVGMGYTTRFGEIDIIARKDHFVVFVEVKLRKNDKFGTAASFVTPEKQQRVVTTAGLWLVENDEGLQPRFDVIEVYAPDGVATVNPKINHIVNAFSQGHH